MPLSTPIARFLDPGWNRFVAAFLYYVALTAFVLGGVDFSLPVMAATYLLPPALYGLLLLRRTAAFARPTPAGRLALSA